MLPKQCLPTSVFYYWLGFQGVFMRKRENKRLTVLCWHFGAVWKWEWSRSDIVISPFTGKSNVSGWMDITKHTVIHPNTVCTPWILTWILFVVGIVGKKVEDNLLLPHPQISYPTMKWRKHWSYREKNSWFMYLSFLFLSFFSSYNPNQQAT